MKTKNKKRKKSAAILVVTFIFILSLSFILPSFAGSVFISPTEGETFHLGDSIQVVANLSNATSAEAYIEGEDGGSFYSSLRKNNEYYESGFFKPMDVGAFNLTIFTEKKTGESIEHKTKFYLVEEDDDLEKERQTERRPEIISPEKKEYGPNENIQLAINASGVKVNSVKGFINSPSGKIEQPLYSQSDSGIYEGYFSTLTQNGKYSADFIIETEEGVLNKSRDFFVKEKKREFKEPVTIEVGGERKEITSTIRDSKADSPFETDNISMETLEKKTPRAEQAMENLLIRNITNAIDSIEFYNITTGRDLDIRLDDLERQDFVQSFAIDPEQLNFTNATVNITAQGQEIYKCEEWDYESQSCYGEWKLFKTNLTPGKTYSFTLTPDDPGFGEVAIDRCRAQDMASSSDTWGTSCDYSYPSQVLYNEGGEQEVHQIHKQGNTVSWAGLKITSINESVQNCGSVEEVQFCYKWWADTARTESCEIRVSADGEETFSTVTQDCPPEGETGGVNCVDVTQMQDWQCDTFYGSSPQGGVAEAELVHRGDGGNSEFNVYWDVFYFNVSYRDPPPVWSNESQTTPETYCSDTESHFNITWIDNVDVEAAYFESNFTGSAINYTMNGSSKPVYTFEEIMPAGSFYWKSHANDTIGNWSTSNTRNFSIEKSKPELFLTVEPGWDVTYGTQTNVTCTADTDEVTTSLYRNGTYVGKSDILKLGAGTYNYTCNTTATQNYTSHSTSNKLLVEKAEGDIRLYLDGLRKDREVENETYVNITAILREGADDILVDINNTLIYNGTSPSENITLFDYVDLYKITATYPGSENFTFDKESWLLNVTLEPPPVTPPDWSENESYIVTPYEPEPSVFEILWQDEEGVDTVLIETNKTGEPKNYTMEYMGSNEYNYSEVFSAGNFYWKSYANDTLGNWSATPKWNFTIEKADPGLELSSEPGWDITYGTQTNVTCTADTDEATISLYRNSTKVEGSSDTTKLDAGNYEYKCNATETQNYTSSSVSQTTNVQKAESEVALYIDGSREGKVVENNTFVDIDAELLTGEEENITVKRNESLLYEGLPPYSTNLLFNEIANYNISLIYEGSDNYYPDEESWLVTVVSSRPVSKELTIQDCAAQDAAEESGTFDDPCDFDYPGPYLFYDNDATETHQVGRHGGTAYWAGLRTINYNESIDKCVDIERVNVCYQWWAETEEVDSCSISVSADGGQEYSNVTTDCPPNGYSDEITCVDVTQLEDWQCDTFFNENPQAVLEAELLYSGGDNVYHDVNWNVYYFNVSYTQDVEPPIVSIQEPESLIYLPDDTIKISARITDKSDISRAYANVTWSESSEIVELEDNGDNIYAGKFTNTTHIGRYNVTFFANDTYNNINDTEKTNFRIDTSPYHVFYGNASSALKLGKGSDILFDYGITDVSNIFAADAESDFDFDNLQAIGRKKDGSPSTDDFACLDKALSMSNYSTSFERLWAKDSSTPEKTDEFNIYGRAVENVPIVNSTESGNFTTGILWDTGKSEAEEFNSTEKQDIVFVTKYNKNTTGMYGTYGFEVLIPETLGQYKEGEERVNFITEI
ncbi:MAG: hypothetical protein ACOCZ6_04005 [Nanoarchaeota archaeon]